MMREIGQRRKKEKEPYPFGEPWGWRVVLYRIGVGGGLFCWAMSFFLCPWHTLYSLGGNHYAAADGEGSIGYHISSGAACRCIFLGRPLLALAIILLPTGYSMLFVMLRRMNKREREKKSENKTGT